MQINDLIQKIDDVILLQGRANASAANRARTLMYQRVFEQGKKANGGPIGNYSTKDMLIGDSSFLTKGGAQKVFGSKKKRRELEWRTVNGNRLAVLKGGYKKLKDIEGRNTAFIDLLYSGNLSLDLTAIPSDEGFDIGFLRADSVPKVEGNQARFGDIFSLSNDEIKEITNIYLNEAFAPFD